MEEILGDAKIRTDYNIPRTVWELLFSSDLQLYRAYSDLILKDSNPCGISDTSEQDKSFAKQTRKADDCQ